MGVESMPHSKVAQTMSILSYSKVKTHFLIVFDSQGLCTQHCPKLIRIVFQTDG